MLTIINPNREKRTFEAVREFSETSRPFGVGVVKGNSSKGYSWLADMLFKQSGNTVLNPHIARINFVGNRDIVYQEFGNVSDIYSEYTLFSQYDRTGDGEHSYELTTRQYQKIGQKSSDFDVVEYFNESYYEEALIDVTGDNRVLDMNSFSHEFGRAPVFVALGYKMQLDQDNEIENNKYYYDQFVWSRGWGYMNTQDTKINFIDFIFSQFYQLGDEEDLYQTVIGWSGVSYTANTHVNNYVNSSYPLHLSFDYKLNIDNAQYGYFHDEDEWVYYYNSENHYRGQKYYPYIGAFNLYNNLWGSNRLLDTSKFQGNLIDGAFASVLFFPEIIYKGNMEPAKIIASNMYSNTGQITYNPGCHLNEPDDNSKLLYNICNKMVEDDGGGKAYTLKYTHDGDTEIIGIDIETERQRRYSAIVTTEPYMTTKPIAGGTVVEYRFIDGNLEPVIKLIDNQNAQLEIKAPLSFLMELDRILDLNEKNTDIIDVAYISDLSSSDISILPGGGAGDLSSDSYDDFGSSTDTFKERSNIPVDDLIDGVAGSGRYKEFYINTPVYIVNNDKYFPPSHDHSGMKVCGLGLIGGYYKDNNGVMQARGRGLKIYLTNFYPTAAPAYDSSGNEISNDNTRVNFIQDGQIDKISYYETNETFRPMIKLPHTNGFMKILKRNRDFQIRRADDGSYLMVYDVEFPFCFGMYDFRNDSNFFDGGYKHTQILYKESYISAGSWAIDSNNHYDNVNQRYAPQGNDSFNYHCVFQQYSNDDIYTDREQSGGKYFNSILPTYKQVVYPANTVYLANYKNIDLLSVIKPRPYDYSHYGTYFIKLNSFPSDFDPCSYDWKIFSLCDNRQWRFGKNRFSSYIGRENPIFEFDINVSALFNEYWANQKNHACIPDMKRWLYAEFRGFAYSMVGVNPESIGDEDSIQIKTSIEDGIQSIPSKSSESDIIIEILDKDSNVGNDYTGNWRPFSPSIFDNNKIIGQILFDNIGILEAYTGSPFIDAPSPSWNESGLKKIYITYYDADQQSSLFIFPESYNGLSGLKNKVLYNAAQGKSYHIAYIGDGESYVNPSGVSTSYTVYPIYIKITDDEVPYINYMSGTNAPTINVENYQYSIYNPKSNISKKYDFEVRSSVPSTTDPGESRSRYIDLKDFEELSRYIYNNTIKFRVRVRTRKTFEVSYVDEDTSSIQYEGEKSNFDQSLEYYNNPWENSDGYNEGFDWRKVFGTSESTGSRGDYAREFVRRFGVTYFKCASK